MSLQLVKMALVVAMTHGFRAIGRRAGPRWGALALGLPCTTAVALIASGTERGVLYSASMAEMSLIGLVGAVSLPLAYARALEQGWRTHWAMISGVLAYLMAALVAGRICPSGGSLLVAMVAVGSACILVARRSPLPVTTVRFRRVLPSKGRIWALRTIVPVACLMASAAAGELSGPAGAGLLSTFPGLTLTVLLLTHLEAGPTAAIRMARTLPPANLGMVAFLATFRHGSPAFGLPWGTAMAYLAAIGTLAVVAHQTGRQPGQPESTITWPRPPARQFRPIIESLAA